MTRLMIIPAAGTGSRLGGEIPKALAPVAGRPMIDHLLRLYAPTVDAFVVVVSPAARAQFEAHLGGSKTAIDLVEQPVATGMLDALLEARDCVSGRQLDRVWITWCDQLAVSPSTIARLIGAETTRPEPAMVLPTCQVADPYIHFERDVAGRIVAVRHRREGDPMPPIGESDMGLFSLSREAFLRELNDFAEASGRGDVTRERNFLPFIPWLAADGRVVTFPCADPIEAVGINTPEDLRRIEEYFRETRAGTVS